MSAARPDHSARAVEWRDTFTEICDRHRGRLIRWLTAIFGARDAEDIAQEALVRLYTRPGLVVDSGDAWPWLAVVARNVGRDLVRHNALSTTVETSRLALLADEVRVCDEVLARDEADRLARALRSLSPRERAVIRLRDFEGNSIADISELVGINENAVRQQLFRARRRLATVYVDMGGDSRWGTLVAALGLRFRELARRFGPVTNEAGAPTAMAVAAALPAIAAAVALGIGLGAEAAPDTTGFGREDVRVGGLVERGVDRLAAVGVSIDLARPGSEGPRVMTRPPTGPNDIINEQYDIANTHHSVVMRKSPLTDDEGEFMRHSTMVDTPIGPVGVTTWGRRTEGESYLCRVPMVRCTDG